MSVRAHSASLTPCLWRLPKGQQVVHCGRRALSAAGERITMVTSYVPSDPCAPDRSVRAPPPPAAPALLTRCACLQPPVRLDQSCMGRLTAAPQRSQVRPDLAQVLRGPRPVSNLDELYYDWAKYRFASLAGQVAAQPFQSFSSDAGCPRPAKNKGMHADAGLRLLPRDSLGSCDASHVGLSNRRPALG